MKTTQLRHLAEVWTSSVDKHTVDGEVSVQLCNYTDAYKKDRVRPGPDLMRATATIDEVRRNRLRIGDSVFTKDSEDPQDIGISAYVDGEAEDFVCGYHLAIARPALSTHPRYLTWALRSRPVLDHFGSHAAGISRYGIGLSDLRAAPIPDLHPEEQRRIADFLDDRVSRIDRIIAARREQIASMTALVAETVRLGVAGVFDDISAVKETSIGWLRYVHDQAKEVSLSRVVTLQRGVDLTEDERQPGNVPVVTTAGIAGMHDQYVELGPGVIVGRYGSVGNVHWVDGPYWPHNTTLYVRMTHGNNLRWVYYLLLAFPYRAMQARAAVPGVNRNDLATETVPWVPLELQRAAVERLDAATINASERKAALSRSIALLTEYKSSLITAAVTGELDVTTAGSNTPG